MPILNPSCFEDPQFRARLVGLRRDFHRHPELGFAEVQTAARITQELEALGLEPRTQVATTGVVVDLVGNRPGPTVLVRADMDGLPLQEANPVPYASEVPGAMHACGHDGHMAILLGVAEVLVAQGGDFPGTIRLIFQPAEEGPGGALPMIQEGVLEDPKVDFAIGLHLWNELPVGHVGVLPGPAMAAVNTFDAWVTARGGHASAPHQSPDPVLTAGVVVQSWQSIVARLKDPNHPAVISVSQIHGGTAPNIIPAEVHLRGTVRSFDPQLRDEIPDAMERILDGVTSAYRCGYRFEWQDKYPATVNHPDIAQRFTEVLESMDQTLVRDSSIRPCMGAEDMSYYLEKVPGCFVFLGSAPAGTNPAPPHHSNLFDFDEDALVPGAELLTRMTLSLLESPPEIATPGGTSLASV